jgi:hypothetical protein
MTHTASPLDHRTLDGLDHLIDWAMALESLDNDGSHRAQVIAYMAGRLTLRELTFWREVFAVLALLAETVTPEQE